MANVSYQATSNSIGTGLFTFNEDVSTFLSPGQVFDGYIHHEWVHVWDGGDEGEQSSDVMEYEDNTCTYIGDGIFSRDAVELSSNANDFVDFTVGLKEIMIKLGDDAIIPPAFELPTTLNVNAVNVNTPPTAYGVSISTNRIGINVASASMGIHLEKDDAQILQYDTGAVISDLRPAWLTGPSGADWRVSSTNNTTTPLPNEINRLLLTPAGVLNVNGSVMVGANIVINTTSVAAGANVIINATQIVAGVSVMNTTQIAVGANVIMNTTAVAVGTNIMNSSSVSVGGSMTATQLAVGANVLVNATSFKVGNSTANVVITGTAITLANTSQTLDIGAPRVLARKFTASGTYTPTAGTRYCMVEIVGGGGAGGGADATAAGQISGGAGGGGAGYVRKLISLPAAASITLGAAGAGSAGNSGGNGGDSTYDDGTYTLIANGGDGGTLLPATTQDQPNNGGTPGGASGGDINMGGNPGGSCHAGATRFQTGPGGGSYFGGGGLGASCASSTSTGAGSVGSGNGSGGGGAVNAGAHGTALAGGAGKAGMCIITEYVW